MKCVLSGTVAFVLRHDLPSIHSNSLPIHSIHVHTTIHPSLTNFISLYFTSCNITALHFTSFHFTTYFMICTTPSLKPIYRFPSLFLKIT
jgi:hypothetical protein